MGVGEPESSESRSFVWVGFAISGVGGSASAALPAEANVGSELSKGSFEDPLVNRPTDSVELLELKVIPFSKERNLCPPELNRDP